MSPELPQVLPLRQASREMVRELGFLQTINVEAGIPHSQCHALLEVERLGRANQKQIAEALRLDKSTTSRLVAQLVQSGWVKAEKTRKDGREKEVVLTARGREKLRKVHEDSNERVQAALATLKPDERVTVLQGIALYAEALKRSRIQSEYEIRAIRRADNPQIKQLIQTVMPEFGASGAGFAIHDPEVEDMFFAYTRPRCAYFVVASKGRVLGIGGVAPLEGGDAKTCELRKMYFLPELRGKGIGQKLLARCLEKARELGYKRCYLETLKTMRQARALYEKNGFKRLEKPCGSTGHFGCDAWYAREL